jgi:hypothetical protein
MDGSSSSQGLVTRIANALQTPFNANMSWLQLAAVVIFISIVLFAWRQVILFIDTEV